MRKNCGVQNSVFPYVWWSLNIPYSFRFHLNVLYIIIIGEREQCTVIHLSDSIKATAPFPYRLKD